MQRWRGLEAVPPGWGRCVATIGVFDGVHRGHQQIISCAVDRARSSRLPAVVITFDPHPAEVVRPGTHPTALSTPHHKAELVEALGADVLCLLPFTLEFSRMSPKEFAHAVLVERLHAARVVVGDNFRFGHGATGGVDTLAVLGAEFGFAAEGVPLLSDNGTTISSTYVRACVDAGDVAAAAAALGRPHRLEGIVVRGDARGREIGFPTANLQTTPYAAVPADGVYAGYLVRRSGVLLAAISIGTNPTFAGRERRVEAYVLDFDGDLYGEPVAIDFVSRLRDTERFASVDLLVAQMHQDVARTRAELSREPHPSG
ncbi:MAG: riboflavin kinase / adenylyltransferase [Frankiaceae bacterium]|nr:riboflavin kinase / adenylyltransferase [Frankiaceae bacterium]